MWKSGSPVELVAGTSNPMRRRIVMMPPGCHEGLAVNTSAASPLEIVAGRKHSALRAVLTQESMQFPECAALLPGYGFPGNAALLPGYGFDDCGVRSSRAFASIKTI